MVENKTQSLDTAWQNETFRGKEERILGLHHLLAQQTFKLEEVIAAQIGPHDRAGWRLSNFDPENITLSQLSDPDNFSPVLGFARPRLTVICNPEGDKKEWESQGIKSYTYVLDDDPWKKAELEIYPAGSSKPLFTKLHIGLPSAYKVQTGIIPQVISEKWCVLDDDQIGRRDSVTVQGVSLSYIDSAARTALLNTTHMEASLRSFLCLGAPAKLQSRANPPAFDERMFINRLRWGL